MSVFDYRSYIKHEQCDGITEGFATTLHMLMPVLDIAERLNLIYVCDPDDFRQAGHILPPVGNLFGCGADEVQGNTASWTDIQQKIKLGQLRERNVAMVNAWSERIRLNETVEPGVVYRVVHCDMNTNGLWGRSFSWFRSQYHLVRKSDS